MKKIILAINLVLVSVFMLGSIVHIAEAKTVSKNTTMKHKKVITVKTKKVTKKKIVKKTKATATTSKILSAPLIDPNNPPGGR